MPTETFHNVQSFFVEMLASTRNFRGAEGMADEKDLVLTKRGQVKASPTQEEVMEAKELPSGS